MSDENLPVKDIEVYGEALLKSLRSIPEELFELKEDDLKKKVNPTLKLYEIKQRFWEELSESDQMGRKMRMYKLYEGICTSQYFYKTVMQNPNKMAWIAHPLATYENKAKAALQRAQERYEEIFNMDITTTKYRKVDGEEISHTEVDPRKVAVLLSAIKQVEDRVRGGIVQKQITQNVGSDKPELVEPNQSVEDLDKKIRELEKQMGTAPVEVDYVETQKKDTV